MPFLNKRDTDSVEGCACGLVRIIECPDIWRRLEVPVPLKMVNVTTNVTEFIAEVIVEQEYVNREETPIEAVYMFPIEEEAAVIGFEAEVDGRTIKTVVKPKEEAKKEYEEAVQENKTAFMLEQTKVDVFEIKVGHLKPGAGAKIRIKYTSELPAEDKAVRLSVPTTIAPRYVPPTDDSEEAKKLQGIRYSFESPAPLKIAMNVTMKGEIRSLKSPSHQIKTEGSGKHMTATLEGSVADLDRDFVAIIESEGVHEAAVYTEHTADSSAAMVSLVPSFNLRDQKCEFIFVIDRSGSMGGQSIAQAKEALKLFMHSLPAECKFNIFSFGSHFDSLFPQSVAYSDETLARSKGHIAEMDANYGGTEIFPALEAIYKQPKQEGFLKQIFLLTDGEVSNDDQVIALVRRNAKQGRLFSLGLGAGASRHLVKGVARAGGGTAVFATYDEDLRPKVLTQLKNAKQPALSDISVTWDWEKEKPEALVRAPREVPPAYDGSRMLIYFTWKGKAVPKGATISANSPDGVLSVAVGSDAFVHRQETDALLHRLAGRKSIQDLEEDGDLSEEARKSKIVELAVQHHLASKHTSFIGVDDKTGDKVYDPMVTRDVPNQVMFGYGAPVGRFAMAGAPMAMACSFAAPAPQMRMCKSAGGGAAAFGAAVTKMASVVMPECDMAMDAADAMENVIEAAPPKAPDATDVMDLQGSSGVFRWGDILGELLSKSKEQVLKAAPAGVDEEVWITAIAVNLLEAKFASQKDLFELVIEKAMAFINKKTANAAATKNAMDKAKELVAAA